MTNLEKGLKMGKLTMLMFSEDPKEKALGYALYAGFCIGITYLSGKLMGKIVAKEVVKRLI